MQDCKHVSMYAWPSPSTAQSLNGAVCLTSAGSFGRVYKGRWRGLEVAVKVLQHSRAAAASVANEVDLMMSFQHPNIVSALHFVSWRKRKPPKVDPFETLVSICIRQPGNFTSFLSLY